MNRPLVSVTMVVCNVDRFLAEAINSILRQTFKEFEFIIVDFGSTDRSKSIILEYQGRDNRIKFHTIPPCGLGEARNAAAALAQGQYIAIMDADDIAVRDRLAWQIDFMDKHREVGVLGGAVEFIPNLAEAYDAVPQIAGSPLGDHEIRSALLWRCPFWQPTVLLRTEAFISVGGYRPPFAPAEDYDLWLRIGERFQLANLEHVVLKYRIHPNQVSQRKLRQQTLSVLAARAAASSRRNGAPDPLNSVTEITPAVLAGLGVSEAALQRALAYAYMDWIRHSTLTNQHSAALGLAMEMLGSSDWKYADKRVVADLRLLVARAHWRQKKWLRSFLTVGQAVMTRPAIIGRPLRPLLRRVRLCDGRTVSSREDGEGLRHSVHI